MKIAKEMDSEANTAYAKLAGRVARLAHNTNTSYTCTNPKIRDQGIKDRDEQSSIEIFESIPALLPHAFLPVLLQKTGQVSGEVADTYALKTRSATRHGEFGSVPISR